MFNAACDGRKTAELRKNDRDFKVGDVLRLHTLPPGMDPGTYPPPYHERSVFVLVTHVVNAERVIGDSAKGFVMMSISRNGVMEAFSNETRQRIEREIKEDDST
jgi:hypothetical protein